MMDKICEILKTTGHDDNVLIVKLLNEIMIYRRTTIVAILIMMTTMLFGLYMGANKRQPIVIPGISNKTIEVSDANAPIEAMRLYADVYVVFTQEYNYNNYLSRLDRVKEMIHPDRTSIYENEYRKYYDNYVQKYRMSSSFMPKGQVEINRDKWNVTIRGTRVAYIDGAESARYESSIIITFRKSSFGISIEDVKIEEKKAA